MAIKLRKEEVSNVPATHAAFYVNPEGNVETQNAGVVSPSVTLDGSPVVLENQTTPSFKSGAVKVYAKDVSGNSEFFVLDSAGSETQITSAGSLYGAPTGELTIDWKGGTPGNPYVTGDVVNAAVSTVVMLDVADPDPGTVNMPAADGTNVGKTIFLVNLNASPSTTLNYVPASGEALGLGAVDTAVNLLTPVTAALGFVSDGNGRWRITNIGGEQLLVAAP